jgi:hypothetical protein
LALSLEPKLIFSMDNSFSKLSEIVPLTIHSLALPRSTSSSLAYDMINTPSSLLWYFKPHSCPSPNFTLLAYGPGTSLATTAWQSQHKSSTWYPMSFSGPKDLQSLKANNLHFLSSYSLCRKIIATEKERRKKTGETQTLDCHSSLVNLQATHYLPKWGSQ